MTASDEAKKALEGVTPGPWAVLENGFGRKDNGPTVYATDDELRYIAKVRDTFNILPTPDINNARFIAWAREGVPALLAEIAAKDAEIARLTAQPSPDVAALVEAVDHLLHNYLLDEHDEQDLCVDDNHWSAIHDAFTALSRVKGGEA